MKKSIIFLAIILTSTVVYSQGLKSNASYIKDTYPVEYEATIKKQALIKWGDDFSMVVYEINNESDSLVKLIDAFKDNNTNIIFKAILKWSVDGYKNSNEITFKKMTNFGLNNLVKMNCDWSMVLYEYKKQVKAKNSLIKEPSQVQKRYYDTGKIKSEVKFIDGKMEGLWKFYYANGQLNFIGNNKNGKKTGEWKYYFENGKISELDNYKDDKLNGRSEQYHSDGKLIIVRNYKNGEKEGSFESHYDNGELKVLGNFVKGELTGEWKYYYTNGKLKRIGKLINGLYTGEWKYYFENGELSKILVYLNDKLLNVKGCFDENGNKLDKGTLINGNGTLKKYDSKANLISIDEYENGVVKN